MRVWWLKAIVIGGLTLLLAIPLALLRGLVGERQARAAEAAAEIARSSSQAQVLAGPFIALDAERVVRSKRTVNEAGQQRTVVEETPQASTILIPPVSLKLDGTLKTEVRRRGLFAATLYHASVRATGRVEIPSPPPPTAELVGYRVRAARLVLGLGDSRGVERIRIRIGGRDLPVEPGSPVAWLPQAVHGPLPADMLVPAQLDFDVDLGLTGTESVAMIPLGGDNDVSLESDWPHPGFGGNYLPSSHRIDAGGFRATWKISRLASQAQQRLIRCGALAQACPPLFETAFQVRFVDPVDRYLKTDRAMKYCLVFLTLVFGAVFFIEALKDVRVHPMQYILTGLAVGMFFLLLLSLAEHVGFGLAYALAALACVALISSYMTGVLGSVVGGWGFGVFLAGLYALLYGVLQTEDYALLMGTLTLFAFLSFVMIATRRLNWSGVVRL